MNESDPYRVAAQLVWKRAARTEITKGMMSKIRRAFKKAGKEDAPEKEKESFLRQLLALSVPVMNRSSGRISKVIKGEQSIQLLRESARVAKKAADEIKESA